MVKGGGEVREKRVEELIRIDGKELGVGNRKVEIAEVNRVDIGEVTAREDEIEGKMNEVMAGKGVDVLVVVMRDMVENECVGVGLGREVGKVEKGFKVRVAT
uniref:DHHA2 domain-containing protein n=1 Tax=Bacillus pumilus TaxID=1408 RepID=UPI0028D40E58